MMMIPLLIFLPTTYRALTKVKEQDAQIDSQGEEQEGSKKLKLMKLMIEEEALDYHSN